jgi:hypothetical protein
VIRFYGAGAARWHGSQPSGKQGLSARAAAAAKVP